ncbi:scm-like with four MBT domains protein 2 isoform X2 [Ixodes scapularis]
MFHLWVQLFGVDLADGGAPPAGHPDTLTSNPLEWSVADVTNFVRNTPCSYVARRLHEQEIDGQALLLLTLPMVQEFLDLQGSPAVQFCQLLERLKLAFYLQYAPKGTQ